MSADLKTLIIFSALMAIGLPGTFPAVADTGQSEDRAIRLANGGG